jgi:hypothetical protein
MSHPHRWLNNRDVHMCNILPYLMIDRYLTISSLRLWSLLITNDDEVHAHSALHHPQIESP